MAVTNSFTHGRMTSSIVGLPGASTKRSVLNNAIALSASDWNNGGDVIRLSDATILRSQSGHAVVQSRSAIDDLQAWRRRWGQTARSRFFSGCLLGFFLATLRLALMLVRHQRFCRINAKPQILAVVVHDGFQKV